MPTTRPRHSITETDDLARALDDAAKRWPGERRAWLLVRLVQEGHQVVQAHQADATKRRRAAVLRTRGAVSGAYDDGYLRRLRDDWPD
ncbi:MAG: hypothetical protein ACR2LK_07330 [Solirubrobacteraceae bacterium]